MNHFINNLKVIRKLILLTIFINYSILLSSQDLHFTNYRNISSFFNPAYNGDFSGTYKIQANARSQFDNTYKTAVFGVAYNLWSPLKSDKHWIGIGIDLEYDKSGDLAFGGAGGGLLLSYHIMLDKKGNSVFSIGGSYKSTSVGFTEDSEAFNDAQKISSGSFNKDDYEKIDNISGFSSWDAGISFKSKLNKSNEVKLGVAMMHLNKPHFTFSKQGGQSTIGRRLNINANFKSYFNNRFSLEPSVYYSIVNDVDKQSNINLQMVGEYQIKKKGKWWLIAGLGYRTGDSFDIITGMRSENTYISFSFDVNVSEYAKVINRVGALELGAYHIILVKQKIKFDPVIYCPRL